MNPYKNKTKYSHLAEEGVRLYKEGLSCREVAKILGVKRGVVNRWMNNMGITRPSWLARQGKANLGVTGEKHPNWKGGISFAPDYCWGKKLMLDHGMTVEEYRVIWQRQKGLCGICNKTETEAGRRLAVDHCHKTGRVRGLLCGNCNRGIGNLQENIITLQSAINYLRRNKSGKS